jgi:hypothetical protein
MTDVVSSDFDRIDAEVRDVFFEELVEQLELLRRDGSMSTRKLSDAIGTFAQSAELVGATRLAGDARHAAKLLAAHASVTPQARDAVRAFSEEAIAMARYARVAGADRMEPVLLQVGSGATPKPWWQFW